MDICEHIQNNFSVEHLSETSPELIIELSDYRLYRE